MERDVPENVEQLMYLWLETKKKTIKASSYATYRHTVEAYIIPILGSVRLADVDHHVLRCFVDQLFSREISEKSVCDINSKLNAALQWAAERRYLPHAGFCVKTKYAAARSAPILSSREKNVLEQFLFAADDDGNVKTGVLLCLKCGIKAGELCALQFQDFDRETGILRVHRRLQRIAVQRENTRKTEISIFPVDLREVPVPGPVAARIKELRCEGENAFLLTGRADKCMEPRLLQVHLKSYLRTLGLDESIGFNALKATYISSTLDSGADLCDVGKILGLKRLSHISEKYRAYSFDKANPVRRHLSGSAKAGRF